MPSGTLTTFQLTTSPRPLKELPACRISCPLPVQGVTELIRTPRSRAGTMVLAHDDEHGGTDNRLSDTDRWIIVLTGSSRAVANNHAVDLVPDMVLLIEAEESLTLKNNSQGPLELLIISTRAD